MTANKTGPCRLPAGHNAWTTLWGDGSVQKRNEEKFMKKFAMTMITLSLSAMLLAGCGDSAKETEQESLTGGEQ